MIISIIYLIAIAGAELVTVLVSPLGGVTMHIIIIFALIIHASLITGNLNHRLYLAIALAPLIRILSLSMPLGIFPKIYWYVIIAVPMFLAVFVVVRRLGYTRWEIGLNLNKLPYQFLIMLTGVPFGIAEYYILKPSPLVDSSTWEGMLLPALILIVCTGFVEELCFRGVMQLSAGEALGQWGWIYIAVLFAAMHIGYLSIWDGIFVLAVGLFFGLMVNKTRSIIGVTLSHGITNVILYLVAPFYF